MVIVNGFTAWIHTADGANAVGRPDLGPTAAPAQPKSWSKIRDAHAMLSR